jgi:signal transduction histidine kinase
MAELARMNRRSTVGELSASIAHELAQPLSAILRNTEAAELILQKGSQSDLSEIGEIMTDIARDQRRASEVIRRLRGLLARTPSETHAVDLNEVVEEVFQFISAQAAAHQVSLTTSLASRALIVNGDRIQLQQVVLNLVMNSIEAMGSAPAAERTITARTSLVDDATAEVSIADSGPGITHEKIEQIFEPFFSTKDAGMGMGLSIAHTIVASHRGRIWAANRREGGAVLRFTVPLAKTERPATAGESAGDPGASSVADPRVDRGLDTAQCLAGNPLLSGARASLARHQYT